MRELLINHLKGGKYSTQMQKLFLKNLIFVYLQILNLKIILDY